MSPAGCRKNRPRCHSSAGEPDKNRTKIHFFVKWLLIWGLRDAADDRWPYPSLSESTLQLWQLGCGTPGLSDQAFICDWRAAEVQHRLDRLALLHAHLPLRKHGHRSHQQLLQEGLGLREHLRQREVGVNFTPTGSKTADLLKIIYIPPNIFVLLYETYWFDVFNSALKTLENLLSLSRALWVSECLRVEAGRTGNQKVVMASEAKLSTSVFMRRTGYPNNIQTKALRFSTNFLTVWFVLFGHF